MEHFKELASLDPVFAHSLLSATDAEGKQENTETEINKNIEVGVLEKINELRQKYPIVHEAEYILENGKKEMFEIFTESQGGGNTGFYAVSKNTGNLYYIKYPKNPSAEALASDLYRLAGINVPEITTIKLESGKQAVLSKYIPNLKVINSANNLVNFGFGMDALIANWDAVQSNNTMTDGKSATRIDVGCCFNYRSHGQNKLYNEIVNELYSLIDPKYGASAEIFSTMTREECIASLKNVANIDINKAKELFILHNQENYFEIFKARIDFIDRVCKKMEKTPQNNLTMFEYMKSIVELVSREISFEKQDSNITNINELENIKQQLSEKISNANSNETFENICNTINNLPYSLVKLDLIEQFRHRYSEWKQNPDGISANQIIEDYIVSSVKDLKGKIPSKYHGPLKFKGNVTFEKDNKITTIERVDGGYRVVTKTKATEQKTISTEQRIVWYDSLIMYCFRPIYKDINRALEALDRNEPISQEMQVLINNIEELIENQPPSKIGNNQIVYRKELSYWAIEELEKITGTNLKDMQSGDVIRLNAELKQPHFISTSKNPDGGYAISTSEPPKVRYELQVGEGCKAVDVIDYFGVEYFEENEIFARKAMQDMEMLFQNGTVIKVTTIEKDNDGCFVIKGSLLPVLKL